MKIHSGMTRRGVLGTAVGGLAAVAGLMPARAQSYPSRPLRLILGFPPGGGTDAFARLLAPALSDALGKPVVVENKSGANGNLATEFVSRASPDGYTLLVSTSSQIVAAPHATKNMSVNPITDLSHVTMCTESDFCILANPALPAKTWGEFVARAKAEPGRYIHASPGMGGVNHIGGELAAIRSGIQLKTVQYRGSGPIMTDILADQVNITLASIGLAEPYVTSGRLKALLLMSKNRSPQLPDVPTSVELGLKDLDRITFWVGLHGPKGMPTDVSDLLQEKAALVLAQPEMRKRLDASALRPVTDKRDAFTQRMKSDLALYGEIFKAAGIEPQ